jgi:phosphomannomutase
MHGVSHPWVTKAFETFGFAPFIPVREQQDPDPEFPTVKFPNPEEKGMETPLSELSPDDHSLTLIAGALVGSHSMPP